LLYFVGLGLSAKDISLRALSVLNSCDIVYLDSYTSILAEGGLDEIRRLIKPGKLAVVGRDFLEEHVEEILREAEERRVAIAVIGDPFIATTHISIRVEAAKRGIKTGVIHASSILSAAISESGLQAYKFGKSATIVFPEKDYRPTYPYRVLLENLMRGLHTLFFLDLKAERGASMTIRDGLSLLLEMEREEGEGVLDEGCLAVGLSRLGSEKSIAYAGSFKDLQIYDFGPPPHTLIIPGILHPMEEEALIYICRAPKKVVKEWTRRATAIKLRGTLKG